MNEYGIYLHIPFCRSRCDYCGFFSTCHMEAVGPYFARLAEEIRACPYGGDEAEGRCATLFAGGGTPTAVPVHELGATLRLLERAFPSTKTCERTIECNPDSLDEDKLSAYLEMGFNRFSLGVQTFSDPLLAAVHRRHDRRTALRALELLCRRAPRVSVDLMLGLPGQREEDVREDLAVLLGAGVGHVSAYGLKVEEGTPLAARGYRPDEDRSADFYDLLLGELAAHGIRRYEVSNFARPGEECRHNLRYWRREDYLGFGAAAAGCVGNFRYQNAADLMRVEREEEVLTAEEVAYERVILALRTREGLDRRRFRRDFGYDVAERYGEAIAKCGRFLELTDKTLRVVPEGFYVLHALLVNF